jgi:hypothetical protein
MRELALFPLQAVLFPGGRLPLQIFEARYLDLMGRCLREGSDFGIVHLVEGHEVRRPHDGQPRFATVGTTARIEHADMPRAGLMLVSLIGLRRFRVGALACRENGLWTTQASDLPEDPVVAPAPEHAALVASLRRVIGRLEPHATAPATRATAAEPHEAPSRALDPFADAAWVAHRCCEALPVAAATKQAWLELDDPQARLGAVARWLADQRDAGTG